jgi:type IV secretory pathway VirB6-like protein
VGRTRSCDSSGNPDGLNFDPTTGGKDADFVMSNPVCISVALTTYADVKVAIAAMNGFCGSGSSVPRVTPSPLQDSIDILKATTKAVTGSAQCIQGLAAASAVFGVAIAELATVYGISKGVYSGASVCGSNWMKANTTLYDMSTANYKQTLQLLIEGYMRSDSAELSLDNQNYRQWYYNGVEVEDNPDGSDETCRDPVATDAVTAAGNTSNYNNYPVQKYYLQGLQTGNYNCKRYFLPAGTNDPVTGLTATAARVADFNLAYNCCKKRSQKYICIQYAGTQKFCAAGSLCTINNITFSTESLDNGSLICANTYSLCPYNFSLGGGSQYCDYYQDGIWNSTTQKWTMISESDIESGSCSAKSEIRNDDCTYNDKAGKCRNYCQYLVNCTKTSNTDYQYQSSLGSPYFSDACMNFVGDSQNSISYNGGSLLGSQRHFSAPIAQCMKESLENLFYNQAGHSSCLNTNEYPAADGSCPSGEYVVDGTFIYKKGNTVAETSFFSTVQNSMQDIIKLTLTLSVMFYGTNILLGKNDIRNKKDILVYILKIALVLYFATGDAWQTMFFKGVYGASAEFSKMVFKIGTDDDESKRDGCQFGIITLEDGTTYDSTRDYPSGKEYLALWDTLDCKIMRYLGFGPEVSVANIASLVLAGFLTGPIGIYFALSVMFFGFFFIAATIRALHIFLSSCISIIIFVFISPIIIPCALFQRTEGVFKKWLTNLVSFCFQPIILFAYIAIFCTIFDKTMIGSATFVGTAPAKTLSCQTVCENSDGTIEPYDGDVAPACDQTGQTQIDPMNDSVACLISINSFGKFPGLELIGISIPILTNVFTGDVQAKILTILRGFLVMYLLYKFMDEIPGITLRLIGGGTELPGSSGPSNAFRMLSKTAGFLSELQKRADRGIRKAAGGIASKAKSTARKEGERGTDVGDVANRQGADNTQGGGGSDNTMGGGGSDNTGNP